ncbi:MAG: PorT family protein [Prevotellaceae bacterium]|jgi:hypothetical protein|nr:PorT family protein [Prevotellaceae bacterium]
MRKIVLTIIGLFVISAIASAQELKKDIFGIRAGLNLSHVTLSESAYGMSINIETDSKASFHAGFSYQRLLIPTTPLYLETGFYFSQKGFKYSLASEDIDITLNSTAMYLQIPVLLNYHFAVANNIIIQPFAGLYLSYGIGGKTRMNLGNNKISENTFGDDGYIRIDAGIRLGVGATFDKIYLGIGYEPGLINISNESDITAKNTNWAFTVGYNF